jgi:AraC-like DNA-binding protein
MNAPPFRTARFSTDDFPAEKRLEAYREIYGQIIAKHDVELAEEQSFHFTASLCSVPGLGLASSVTSPCRRIHRPQHIDHDDLLLGISVRGGCVVRQRGREAAIDVGEAILVSGADPVTVDILSTATPSMPQALSLRIPNVALSPLLPALHDRLPWRILHDARGLSLLIGYVEAVRSTNALATPKLRERVVAHVHDLVALLLGAEGDARHAAEARGGRAARREAILSDIERRHADPSLTAGMVAALLGITPRYVHLLLEETGRSFSRHLLERRLEKAAAMLRDATWRGRRIADIAGAAGFADLSHFNRAFRRHFGATPSDIRNSADGAEDGAPAGGADS